MASDAESDAVPIVCPELGANGPIEIVVWLVDPGTAVSAGDRVVELLADGVVVHVCSPVTGVMLPGRAASRRIVTPGETLANLQLGPDEH